jgi:hypothetical protein
MSWGNAHGWFCDFPCSERWAAKRALTVETGHGIGDDDHWLGNHLLKEWTKRQVADIRVEDYHNLLDGMARMVIELSPTLREVNYDAIGIPRAWKKKSFTSLDAVFVRMADDIDTLQQRADMRTPTACGW